MILVIPKTGEEAVVREFFELFKTPWQFYRDAAQPCDVLICHDSIPPKTSARLVLIYNGKQTAFDRERHLTIRSQNTNRMLSFAGQSFPVYGNCLTFDGSSAEEPIDQESREFVALKIEADGQSMVRIGYDLFSEIRHLLTIGQPPEHAAIPTLERHIGLLRDVILGGSIPLVEIPPVPADYNLIACLTHDVDHVGIRNHKWDHTLFGFLYRATIGSSLDVFRRRKTLKQLWKNWKAAFSLPFVHLGMAEDFWYSFDRYLEIEKGFSSTFFMIPKKGEPGLDSTGNRSAKRAAQYDVAELGKHLQKICDAGHEIGVHGIDAWRDSSKGRDELRRISRMTGSEELGVRMHWLYFDEQSPAILEEAGFSYDSTVGYNQTIGFRAGTTQVFKPFQTKQMLELPMHVMDTALFYPSYLNLSPQAARAVIRQVMEGTVQHGGVLTVNWHDRSIAPERLWDQSYVEILQDFKNANAWFATAAQTVAWFRKRRSATFEQMAFDSEDPKIRVKDDNDDSIPGLKLRVYKSNRSSSFVDLPCGTIETPLAA